MSAEPIAVRRATILLKKMEIIMPKIISLVDESPIKKDDTSLSSNTDGKAIMLIPMAIEAIKMLKSR